MPEFGCQESQLVACQIAPRHAGLRVLAELTGTTAGRSACCQSHIRIVPRDVREYLRARRAPCRETEQWLFGRTPSVE
jgi:hypothetical protein